MKAELKKLILNLLGRKEMVLFFYYYLLDVFMELLLVSNIVPFNSSIYKVSVIIKIMNSNFLLVLCGGACWIYLYYLLCIDDEWICGLPMGRGWNKNISLGNSLL